MNFQSQQTAISSSFTFFYALTLQISIFNPAFYMLYVLMNESLVRCNVHHALLYAWACSCVVSVYISIAKRRGAHVMRPRQ